MLQQSGGDGLARLRLALERIPHTPALRTPQVVLRQRVEEVIIGADIAPSLKQAMSETFAQMLQGMGPGFRVLQGGLQHPAFFLCAHPPRACAAPLHVPANCLCRR